MRIAQVSTLATPVRPKGCGSVEGLVWLLARELTRLGHEVTVFAAGGSSASGEVIAALPGSYGRDGAPDDWQLCEWINLCRAVEQSGRFDVIHSHAYLWGIPLEPLARCPMVHTLHTLPDDNHAALRRMAPGARVTAPSGFQWSGYPELPPADVVPHGVDPAQFTFRPEPPRGEQYVCYLGRFSRGKGTVRAIQASQPLGLRLLLAGPRDAYFERHVEPLVDGQAVEYVGAVAGASRDALLGGARALLYPIEVPEPFGLVLPEAMLCGTPVAAIGVGAVPEIVEEGLTGSVALGAGDYEEAILRAMQLDRGGVRRRAEQRFSASRMASDYLKVYQDLVEGRSLSAATSLVPEMAAR